MPIGLATKIAATGFKLATDKSLRKKVGETVSRGFQLLKERAKGAKFVATEQGFSLTADGFSAQGGNASSKAGQMAYSAPGSANYLPYLIGGAVLLMLLKK